MTDFPPEFKDIFGNLKKPEKLTPEQEAGKKLLELARLFPKTDKPES